MMIHEHATPQICAHSKGTIGMHIKVMVDRNLLNELQLKNLNEEVCMDHIFALFMCPDTFSRTSIHSPFGRVL